MCENISLLLSIPLYPPLPPSLSFSLSFIPFRIFLLRLRPTMRLSVSMLSPTNNEKNLRICFEARKIIKNNPFPFFFFSSSPSSSLGLELSLVMAAIVGCPSIVWLSSLIVFVLALNNCVAYTQCVLVLGNLSVCVCVCDCVFVRNSIVPLGQFVCIIIYYAKSCVKIAVASFLLRPDLSPPTSLPCPALPTRSVNKFCICVCMCMCVLSRQTFPFIKLSQQFALPRGENARKSNQDGTTRTWMREEQGRREKRGGKK